jgi:acetyl esterase/lipase/hemerythrin-like domain-containing protein
LVDALLLEHRYIRRLLELLDELTLKIERGPRRKSMESVRLLQTILQYMTDVCDPRHHALEDRLVDTLAQRSVAKDTGILAFSAAHESLHEDVVALQRSIKRVLNEKAEMGSELRLATRHYIDALTGHIELEEKLLFPPAIKAIRKYEWQSLQQTTAPDPLFGGIAAEPYLELFSYLTKRIVSVGEEQPGLVLMRRASATAERLDVLSTGLEDLGDMLVDQARLQLEEQRKSFVRMCKAANIGAAIRLVGEVTATSLQGAKAVLSETITIATTTGGSLIAPEKFKRPEAPPQAPHGGRHQHKLSWQAHALNMPLRLWMKQRMKRVDVANLRSWARHARIVAKALSMNLGEGAVHVGGVRAEWISPNSHPSSRVLLYLPGGSFILPPTPMHRDMIARMCKAIDARALMVQYRLAPEHPFPAGLEDCLAAYRHLLGQGIDPKNIVIAGDSAGGGLTLSTLLALRDAGDPLPGSAVSISPLADLTYSGPSRVYNRLRDPMLPTKRGVHLNDIYLKGHSPDHPLVSPVYGDYTGLPPILIQVGSTEMLLDDSLRVAARARAKGVAVEVEVWREMPHVWHFWKMLPESGKAIDHIATFVRKHMPDLAAAKAA